MVLRATGALVTLTALYYALPLDHTSMSMAILILSVGLVAFVGLVIFQVGTIVRSPYPALRAVEALATSVPFFLLLFAGTYVVLAELSHRSFGVHLSHSNGLYFTVTVFATVGFGDITAKSEIARLVVTVQMITDLVVLGLGVKVILGAVRRGHHRAAAKQDGRKDDERGPNAPD